MNVVKPLFSLIFFGRFWLMFFVGTPLPVVSQTQIQLEKFRGTTIDSATAQPIPQVNIWTNHSSTISDADGNFSLVVLTGDTIRFSHVSYHEAAMKYDDTLHQSGVRISLLQKITLLDEVKIYSYLSESEFRQKIMETIPVLSKEEELAKINSKIITYLARYTPAYPMNAHDNYIDYMKGPQPVVIFSSNPSKGLIRAIKNVIHPSVPSYKRFLSSDSSMRSLHYQ